MAFVVGSQTEAHPHTMPELVPERRSQDGLAINMVIRQSPFTITLDASALLAVAVVLIIGMHFVQQFILECLILAIPLLLLIHNDYENFLRLGPGGTPPTLSGYARLTWYRLFTLRDPFSPPLRDSTISPASGILLQQKLPYRPGPRPTVAGLAPQRQLTQPGSTEAFDIMYVYWTLKYDSGAHIAHKADSPRPERHDCWSTIDCIRADSDVEGRRPSKSWQPATPGNSEQQPRVWRNTDLPFLLGTRSMFVAMARYATYIARKSQCT